MLGFLMCKLFTFLHYFSFCAFPLCRFLISFVQRHKVFEMHSYKEVDIGPHTTLRVEHFVTIVDDCLISDYLLSQIPLSWWLKVSYITLCLYQKNISNATEFSHSNLEHSLPENGTYGVFMISHFFSISHAYFVKTDQLFLAKQPLLIKRHNFIFRMSVTTTMLNKFVNFGRIVPTRLKLSCGCALWYMSFV